MLGWYVSAQGVPSGFEASPRFSQHTDDIGLTTLRWAQMKALRQPRTAYSTAFDGGDPADAMQVRFVKERQE